MKYVNNQWYLRRWANCHCEKDRRHIMNVIVIYISWWLDTYSVTRLVDFRRFFFHIMPFVEAESQTVIKADLYVTIHRGSLFLNKYILLNKSVQRYLAPSMPHWSAIWIRVPRLYELQSAICVLKKRQKRGKKRHFLITSLEFCKTTRISATFFFGFG